MATYYFTYGLGDTKSTNQAFQGGWTEVEAENSLIALKAYKVFHPVNENGLLPCCGVALTEAQMECPYSSRQGYNMLKDGNGGKFCHDRITISREVM